MSNHKRDPRPAEYQYWNHLMTHLHGDNQAFFNGKLYYPRQFEIHLPGNHIRPCDLQCPHCAGKYVQKDLGTWEMDGLDLLNKLQGKIPYHIYGGNYTEPLLNTYFMTYLQMTKKYGNHFGIHTNGTMLYRLEEQFGWLTELNRISTDKVDYLSISLDAGSPRSWGKTKGTRNEYLFSEIIQGVRRAVAIRKNTGKGHAIRLCYLISPWSGSPEEFKTIIETAKEIGVDSLRFSIPFAPYNQSFDKIRKYKVDCELPMTDVYEHQLESYLSKSEKERPYIFYTGPEFTDIDKFDFQKCIYCYYQITYGADGYAYKCSTTATPTMAMCRLGKITNDPEEFNQLILRNANPNWNTDTCFSKGARCNRMGLEINRFYATLGENTILSKNITTVAKL
ncbi:radical SAM protein [bacterium]|nr:MAG: radical SAM protein [bacterium]